MDELTSVREWVMQMQRENVYPPSTATFRDKAIENLATVIKAKEPRKAQWMLDNLEMLGQRYAANHSLTPGTQVTYVTRAKTTLADYLRYKKDPTSFRPRKSSTAVSSEAENDFVVTRSDIVRARARFDPTSLRTFPLGNDRTFAYVLPDDGMTQKELNRLVHHLLTLCTDYDPPLLSSMDRDKLLTEEDEETNK